MVNIDLHAVSSAGNTSALAAGGSVGVMSTILPGGDGATVAGVPIAPNANLFSWGVITTAADTIYEAQMTSQDQWDPLNGEWISNTTTGIEVNVNKSTWLKYRTGARNIAVRQNTGAANVMGYTMDVSDSATAMGAGSGKLQSIVGHRNIANQIVRSFVFGGALTAITWGSQAFAPTPAIPNGYYAILGCKVSEIGANYNALIRFRHADFGLFRPGFPVQDLTASVGDAATNAAQYIHQSDTFFDYQMYQFTHLSNVLGMPCCPVFRATNAGTGLSVDMASITADTPRVTLNLAKVADLNATIT